MSGIPTRIGFWIIQVTLGAIVVGLFLYYPVAVGGIVTRIGTIATVVLFASIAVAAILVERLVRRFKNKG